MNDDQLGPKRSAFQIALGAAVVLLGLAAVVVALAITLRHYPVEKPSAGQPGSDRSSAVVAVLTPVIAGLAAIVGLYFGISATGSGRAQQAKANAQTAQSAIEAGKTAAQVASQAVQSGADANKTAAQAATQAAQSATEAAKSAADAVRATAQGTGT